MSPAAGLKLRVAVLAALTVAPVLFLMGVGSYHLWAHGWAFWYWAGMAGCFFAAYFLARKWTGRDAVASVLPDADPTPGHWTERDEGAWKLVEAHAAATTKLSPDELGDATRYAVDARDLALKIARVYQPDAKDPFGHLTLPEILACGELVSRDLSEMVEKYVPGSHLMTVKRWVWVAERTNDAAVMYPKLRNLYWLATAVIDPIKTGVQVLATKGGLAPMFKDVQNNVLLWFHTRYVHQLGRYLIELNSGRLKVGSRRYRELMEQHRDPLTEAPATASGVTANGEPPAAPNAKPEAAPVTLAVVGPVSAGKSSLVNALLGEQKAATDPLPCTPGATKYALRKPGQPTFTLVDTAGYGNDGASDADLAAALDAARDADVLLLATPANNAARRPEVEFLAKLRAAFAARRELRMPPVVLVLTKADQLSPKAEWKPPYDWVDGDRPKERTMREAVAAAREQFADPVMVVVPVAVPPGQPGWGVEDELVARVAARLGDARGVGLLRALHAEAAADRLKKVRDQVLSAGAVFVRAVWDTIGAK